METDCRAIQETLVEVAGDEGRLDKVARAHLEHCKTCAQVAAEDLGLPATWLNNGPSRGEGGLFQMGLPKGLGNRCHTRRYGSHLTVHFIGRTDQIHFKLYAAADRGGYHIEDLSTLDPTDEELIAAAKWAMTHDVSETFSEVMKNLLRSIGHDTAADQI